MNTKKLTRREFSKISLATIGLLFSANPVVISSFAQEAAVKKIPVGLQLYSVRKLCEKDLNNTLAAVAKMGYKGVEFAGYYGRDAKTLKSMLDDLGLKCCGTHIGLDTLIGNKLNDTIEFNKILNNKYLIVPWLDEKYRNSKRAWQKTADMFNEISEKLKPHGMRVGYHNHNIEFKPIEGELPWDIFFGHTNKDVIMQFDTGNAADGGGDATVFIKRYPGRAITVHIKPYSKSKPDALFGDDELPWKEIFNLCESVGGTEWYIVEYERESMPPLEAVQKCFEALRKMGKV